MYKGWMETYKGDEFLQAVNKGIGESDLANLGLFGPSVSDHYIRQEGSNRRLPKADIRQSRKANRRRSPLSTTARETDSDLARGGQARAKFLDNGDGEALES